MNQADETQVMEKCADRESVIRAGLSESASGEGCSRDVAAMALILIVVGALLWALL